MNYSPPGSLSMGFSRQEYWSGLPFPSPGDLPDPGIEPLSPALAGRFLSLSRHTPQVPLVLKSIYGFLFLLGADRLSVTSPCLVLSILSHRSLLPASIDDFRGICGARDLVTWTWEADYHTDNPLLILISFS